MSIPLPRFADQNFVPSPIQSSMVPTQQYPSSPDSHVSTVCVDLDAFSSECSRSSDCPESDRNLRLVSPGGIYRVSVNSGGSGDDGQTDVSLPLSQFQPLNHSSSSVDVSSDLQVVVESPSHYEVQAVPVIISAFVESVVQLSQMSALSSVQLSPNRVRKNDIYVTMNVFPVFQVSSEIDNYLPATSPVTLPVSGELPTSPATLFSDSLPPGATGLLDSLIGGPVMSRSLIEQATDLSRFLPPLIPLPDDLLLLPMLVPLRPSSSPERQSPVEPVTSVNSTPLMLIVCHRTPVVTR